jgi:hypothetical protein
MRTKAKAHIAKSTRSSKKRNSVPAVTLWQKIDELIEKVPSQEWAKLPKDGAENVDHYLYGAPKK